MNKLLETNCIYKENEIEVPLRPTTFADYIGQERIKENLKVFTKGALSRNEVLDHTLFYGPPGLGKTTLSMVIANEMRANIKIVNGPAIEKQGDLASILVSLQPGDILFIDEIHRLPKIVEEVLYSVLEDFKLSIMNNNQTVNESITIDLPPFTLIGATTRIGDLSAPLRSRFLIIEKLDYYSINELNLIVKRTAKSFGYKIDDDASLEIAKRSRGTPRIANRIFRRIRDFACYSNLENINLKTVIKSFECLSIDKIGLDKVDIKYLKTLYYRFNNTPVGIETIANAVGEEKQNLEEVCEPFLLQLGFIDKTQKGRILTELGVKYLLKNHSKE